MKYLLIHNMDEWSRKKLIQGYLEEGFQIIFQNELDILLKNTEEKIVDEDIYIKNTISFLKRNSMVKDSSGRVVDLTEAFLYAAKKGKFNLIDNKFEWYLRNIMIKEIG